MVLRATVSGRAAVADLPALTLLHSVPDYPEEGPATMPSIFLSHSHADRDFARRLARELAREGVRVWLDEAEIKAGDSLLLNIQSAISEMDYLGVVLSPESVTSNWVVQELRMAMSVEIASGRVKLIPILCRVCEIPLFLRDKRYVDFTKDYRAALLDLFRAIDPSIPAPVFLTAKQAAREAKIRFHPEGDLMAISHVGTVSHFYAGYWPDFYIADAKTGKSRVWCIEFYNTYSREASPFTVYDGEWGSYGKGTCRSFDGTEPEIRPIHFGYIDSDVAVPIARERARLHSPFFDNENEFFVLVHLRWYKETGAEWLVSFYDGTQRRAIYAVRLDPRTGALLEEGDDL